MAIEKNKIKVIARTPTKEEFRNLVNAVGWQSIHDDAALEKLLSAPLYAVVAEDEATNETVGCALLLGDNISFYYVKDVMVHKEWQCKGVGSALMYALNDWVEKNAPHHALVGLYTGENLERFYKQFGFQRSFGMSKRIGYKF